RRARPRVGGVRFRRQAGRGRHPQVEGRGLHARIAGGPEDGPGGRRARRGAAEGDRAVSAAPGASLAESGADVRGMFNRIARRYDATNRAMSVGVDVVWRKKAIARLIEGMGETPRFLDLGAGTLDGALEIARRVPGARVAAADFAREMLVAGQPKVKDGAHIASHAADGHHLPYRAGAFDGAFSAFCIRNLADLPRGMRELRRVARPGGRDGLLRF